MLTASVGLVAPPARAKLWVASPPGEQAVEHVELAYALGDASAATWLSLRVLRGPVAVVVALDGGERVSAAPDAWLTALEDTASPIVVPPQGAGGCGGVRPFVRVGWPRSGGEAATVLALDAAADVATALEAEGLVPPQSLSAAASFAVWIWRDAGSAFTTQTLRIEGTPAALALAADAALPTYPISVSALSSGPIWFETEQDKGALDVTFVAGERPTSDYGARLADFLVERHGPLLETRESALLFDWSLYGDAVSVAPLVRRYADQAADELADVDAVTCREQLAAFEQAGAPTASACGEAVDAGLALGLLQPGRATLQRFQLTSREGVEPLLLAPGGQPSAPLLRAARFDDSACATTEPLPPIVRDPDLPGSGRGPVEGGGTVVVEETVVVVEEEPVELSCGGQPQPEPVDQYDYGYYEDDDELDCSSDTSSSSDSSDEDCSSDTSTSSDTTGGEVDCASDSSSSSSTSDDGCSGDTTTDEGGGYDGDTCTGSAAPRAEQSAAQTAQLRRPRPARLKASAWALGFAALVLPIRRRKRRVGAGG